MSGSHYTGPRRFSTPPTAQELERVVEGIEELWRQVSAGGPLRLNVLARVERSDCALKFGAAVRVDSSEGGTINVKLPPPDARRIGQLCGMIRTSASGTINIIPTGGVALDGSNGSTALSADVGLRLILWDGVAWFSVRGA